MFPSVVSGSLSSVPFVSACRTRALTRTDLDTHADSSFAQDRSQKTSRTFMVAERLT